jgi:hypothetical protein
LIRLKLEAYEHAGTPEKVRGKSDKASERERAVEA